MKSKNTEKEKILVTPPDAILSVIGPSGVQNELLASFLEQKLGVKYQTGDNVSDILALEAKDPSHHNLALLDCLSKDSETIWAELESCPRDLFSRISMVLFNVDPALRIEQEALILGVRGFFYTHDSLDQIQRGVRAVLGGQLWVSREIMSRFIPEIRRRVRFSNTYTADLTPREIEILDVLASGASNAEIAERLHISLFTVKGHLSKAYKKIRVSNRLEAAIWAGKNL